MNLWNRIAQFFREVFKIKTIPPEVINSDQAIMLWHDIFRCKAAWLNYEYVTADGVKRHRKRMTINPAKFVCSELAGLVLAEAPEVTASDAVMEVIEREKLWDNLRRGIEWQAALGGQAIKLVRETDEICLDFVKAMNFVPLKWNNAIITEAAFIDRRTDGAKQYSRIETHRVIPGGYRIESIAFDEETKKQVPLSGLWPDVEPVAEVMTPVPLFVYIRNPEANNLEPESPLGMSIYGNSVDTIQTLDIAVDGMKTELVMGRQRLALPGSVMRRYFDQESNTYRMGFDPTDEAYVRLESDDADKLKPIDLTGQLRMEQWRQAIQTMLNLLSIQVGFSSGYLSFDGVSMKTATEVISENSKTYKTVQAFKDILDESLRQLFQAIDIVSGSKPAAVEIKWQDGVVTDQESNAKYHQDLVLAGLEDITTALMAVHKIDESSALKMAGKIKEEKTTVQNVDLGL